MKLKNYFSIGILLLVLSTCLFSCKSSTEVETQSISVAVTAPFESVPTPKIFFTEDSYYTLTADSVSGEAYVKHFDFAEFPDTTFTFPATGEGTFVAEGDVVVPSTLNGSVYDDFPTMYMRLSGIGTFTDKTPEYYNFKNAGPGQHYVLVFRLATSSPDITPDVVVDSLGNILGSPKARVGVEVDINFNDMYVSPAHNIYFRVVNL